MKSLIKSLFSILFIIVGGPMLFLALVFYLSADDMCGNGIHAEVHSPDHRYKAIVFQRDCGATTGFSTQVSILKIDAELQNDSGNIFVISGHPEAHALQLTWLSNTELLINRTLDASEARAEKSLGLINKITVSYAAEGS